MTITNSYDSVTENRTAGATKLAGSPATLLASLAAAITAWDLRARGRRQLRTLEPHLLKDIGKTRQERDREARKPFWVR